MVTIEEFKEKLQEDFRLMRHSHLYFLVADMKDGKEWVLTRRMVVKK